MADLNLDISRSIDNLSKVLILMQLYSIGELQKRAYCNKLNNLLEMIDSERINDSKRIEYIPINIFVKMVGVLPCNSDYFAFSHNIITVDNERGEKCIQMYDAKKYLKNHPDDLKMALTYAPENQYESRIISQLLED